MIPASANPLLLRSAATGPAAYSVERSIRLNAPDSAYLSRTPASAGNRKTWTWSAWVKRSALGTDQVMFSAGPISSSGNPTGLVLLLWEGDILSFILWTGSGSNVQLKTASVFRDPSAWYHIVAVLDTDNATSSDRVRLFVNGNRITAFGSASYPSQGAQFSVNNTEIHELGRYVWGQNLFLSSYLAECYLIDGQALTPSSFAETNATTGQWVPKAYTGTYGLNGFKLDFSNNANTTTLGYDNEPVANATGGLPILNTSDASGRAASSGTRTDANAANIVLAVPMNGANNGTTFTDQSAAIRGSGSANTITVNGNTITSTAQSRYYGSGGYFDGAGDYLSTTVSGGLGSSSFTIEFWYYKTANSGFLFNSRTSGTGSDGIDIDHNLGITTSGALIIAAATVPVNTWTHVAIVRSGSSFSRYINGSLNGTGSNANNFNGTSFLIGGSNVGNIGYLTGYMQDFRVYSGVAKYTAAFTPPFANDWTPNSLSVTAGASNDSLVDSPTSYGTDDGLGGSVRGNYATWNPLAKGTDVTLANGNLDMTSGSSAGTTTATGTIGVTSGKWYWEITCTGSDPRNGIGIAKQGVNLNSWLGSDALGWGYVWGGQKSNSGSQQSYGASFTANDVVGVAFDADAGTLTFYKNGVSQGQAYSGLTSGPYFPAIADDSGGGVAGGAANFGQRPFAFPVSGFKALCDTNLPEGSITTSGTFTGNANADGPFVWLNGVPTAMTINTNAVTFGTHADKLANGFKLRTNSTSYNTSGSNSYSITTTGAKFKYARAQSNP